MVKILDRQFGILETRFFYIFRENCVVSMSGNTLDNSFAKCGEYIFPISNKLCAFSFSFSFLFLFFFFSFSFLFLFFFYISIGSLFRTHHIWLVYHVVKDPG